MAEPPTAQTTVDVKTLNSQAAEAQMPALSQPDSTQTGTILDAVTNSLELK